MLAQIPLNALQFQKKVLAVHCCFSCENSLFFCVEFSPSFPSPLHLSHLSAVCGTLSPLPVLTVFFSSCGLPKQPSFIFPGALSPASKSLPTPTSFKKLSLLISMTTGALCQFIPVVCKCLYFTCPPESACKLPVAELPLLTEMGKSGMSKRSQHHQHGCDRLEVASQAQKTTDQILFPARSPPPAHCWWVSGPSWMSRFSFWPGEPEASTAESHTWNTTSSQHVE